MRVQLDYAGISAALGLRGGKIPPLAGSTNNVAREAPRIVKEFAPDIKVKMSGQRRVMNTSSTTRMAATRSRWLREIETFHFREFCPFVFFRFADEVVGCKFTIGNCRS